MAPLIGAKFVQEVNAVALAVEKLYPECGSVVELGGQDAKIIIFKEDPETGRKKKIPSMNDKCAGGTGAVIDKINAKLRIPAEQLCKMGYVGLEAASGGRQVRRLRRNRHQRPAEERRAARRTDGLAVRGHRAAEPGRADARQHAASRRCCCSAARTPTSRACRIAGSSTSPRFGKSASSRCPKAWIPLR